MFKAQTDDYTCSPTALYNIGVWLRDIYYFTNLASLCKTDESGTDDRCFELVLRQLWKEQLSIVKKRDINEDDIKDHLDASSTAILLAHIEVREENPEMQTRSCPDV